MSLTPLLALSAGPLQLSQTQARELLDRRRLRLRVPISFGVYGVELGDFQGGDLILIGCRFGENLRGIPLKLSLPS